MLSDDELEAISRNVAKLDLSPAARIRVLCAVVAPLLGQDAAPASQASAASVARGAGGRFSSPRGGENAKKLGQHARAAKRRPGAKPNAKPGEASARAIQTRKANGADREPPPRSLSAAAAAPTRPQARDPDARALAWLEAALERGPAPCADVDAEIDAGRLSGPAVERVRNELDLVCIRLSTKRGAVACYATRDQAAALDARVPPKGGRNFEHTGPRQAD